MITDKYASSVSGGYKVLRGLSTDEKPTDVANGSEMVEIDTGDTYRFDGENLVWLKAGGGSGTQTYTVSGTGTTPVALPEGLSIPDEMTEGFTASLDIAGTASNNEQFDLTEVPLVFISNGSLNFGDIYFTVANDTCAFSYGYIDDSSWEIDSTKPLTWSITFTDAR